MTDEREKLAEEWANGWEPSRYRQLLKKGFLSGWDACEKHRLSEIGKQEYERGFKDGHQCCEFAADDLRAEREKLLELVRDCAKAKDTDEAWGASERCHDYLAALKGGGNV